MSESLISFLGYFLTLPTAILGLYLWFRYLSLSRAQQGLLVKQAERELQFKEMRTQVEALQSSLSQKQEVAARFEKDFLHSEKSKIHFESENSRISKEFAEKLRSYENQLSHYREESATLLAQLKELDLEKVSLRGKLEKDHSDHMGEMEKSRNSLRQESQRLRTRCVELEKKAEAFKIEYEALRTREGQGSEELRRLKRKVQQYHHFFNMVRGQKEMLEERLENWEVALRMLATWSIKEKSLETEFGEQSLGELVAKALQLTQQGPLVNDLENETPKNKEVMHV